MQDVWGKDAPLEHTTAHGNIQLYIGGPMACIEFMSRALLAWWDHSEGISNVPYKEPRWMHDICEYFVLFLIDELAVVVATLPVALGVKNGGIPLAKSH